MDSESKEERAREIRPLSTRFADLPREVVLNIFEHAAQSSSSTCLSLCLVNSWCYQLAHPYLLTTVILPAPISVKRFLAMLSLQSNGGQSVTGSNQGIAQEYYVRSLWMHPDPDSEDIYHMMAHCRNAEHVAMDRVSFGTWVFESALRISLNIHPQPPLERRGRPLQITVNDADARWNRTSLFWQRFEGFHFFAASNITHIRLAPQSPIFLEDFVPDVTLFPRLTHFALPLYLSDSILRSRLEQLWVALGPLLQTSTLQMLVGILTSADGRDLAWAWLRDARQKHTNAYLVEQSGRSIREEWEDEARLGAESIWERAAEYTEKVVEAG